MSINLRNTYINTFKKLFSILPKEFKKRFIGVQLLIIITSIVDLFGLAVFIPIISGIADESALNESGFLSQMKVQMGVSDNNTFLLYLFIIAFCLFIVRTLFILFSNWIQLKFVYDLKDEISLRTYNYNLRSDYEDFMKKDSAEVIRELMVNPNQFASLIARSVFTISSELIVMLLVVFAIALFEWKVFVLIVVTIFPVAFIFNLLVKRRMARFGQTLNDYTVFLYENAYRGILGFVDVKLRQKETTLLKDFNKTQKTTNRVNVLTNLYGIFPAKLFELVTIAGLIVIFCYGAFFASDSKMVLSLIAVYAAAGYRVIPSLSKIVPSILILQQYSFLLDIYKTPLNTQMIKESKDQEVLKFEKDIILNKIFYKFKSAENEFFSNLDFKVSKGEIIGIIGRSGSGKTTLVNLITGFIKPHSGQILIDNQLLTEDNMSNWMRQISYVQQSPYIEKGSLAKNIAFLDEEIDEIRLKEAINKASLNELLGDADPKEFKIEENGKNLSGGQKQRIIIARAMYHQAKLIILDEATSALDNETEQEINESVEKLKQSGVTVIIIAHRLTTLKHTNRIVEMKDGCIIKETKYDEVIANS